MADFTTGLRRGSVTWVVYDKLAFENPRDIKLAELNTTNPVLKLDITCALDEDTTSLTLGASDLDERLSFCDGVGASRPGGLNPEAALGAYRDADRTAQGVFNAFLNWMKHEGFNGYLVQRVGPQDSGATSTTPSKEFEATDDIRVMEFMTDYPVDTLGNEDPALLTITPLPNGFLAWNIKPTA